MNRTVEQVAGQRAAGGPPSGSRLGRLRAALAELAFGATTYEFARHALETRAAMENIFLLVVAGDMLGVPVLPPYYSLRLLPFVLPDLTSWKRRVLRERLLTDEHEFHLHGL